ncbi:MAG: T9SS type A sorting domain-containing protein [candidate division WOR-3 bacterium]|nr:T9SS type A sorting domain-containing protein [candidate division WOR-3 bacterium]
MVYLCTLSNLIFKRKSVFVFCTLFSIANLFALQESGPISRGGEFLIDTTVVYMPTPNTQNMPAISFDGTNYFVVWFDTRSGYPYDLYGARLTQSGGLVDPGGITLTTVAVQPMYPSVAFDGTNYFVVWQDRPTGTSINNIYGARVTTTGILLDSSRIVISEATGDQSAPSVVFDGTNYLVVWQDKRSGYYDIYGSRINQNGVVLDPNGFVISEATNDQISAGVSFDGANCFVVWEDKRSGSSDIYGARVSLAGILIDSSGIPISTAPNDQKYPTIAFDGFNYLVAWEDYRNDYHGDIYGARVNQNGVIIDPSGIAVSTAANDQRLPDISFDGTNYFVVWEDARSADWNIYGARVNRYGAVLDPGGIAISAVAMSQRNPAVSFGGTNYLIAWEDWRNSSYRDLYGARVNQIGVVLDTAGILISCAINSQDNASIAFDGTNYLVVWQENHSGWYSIYGARVSQSGTVVDPNGILIAAGGENPCVAFTGTNYLVVYQRSSNIYGTRVTQNGVVLDPGGIPISTAPSDQWFPSVTASGTEYFVVWHDWRNSNWDIYGTRVTQNGVTLDPSGIPISTVPYTQWFASTAFDGLNYFVIWQDGRNSQDTRWDIYGTRLDQSGTILDPTGIAISTVAYDKWYPRAAFDGSCYFAVWQDYRNTTSDIYGARMNQGGVVIDTNGIAVSCVTDKQSHPAISFDGTNYLVVWEDRRSGLFTDIYGAQVGVSGAVIDSTPISIQPGDQISPCLAHGLSNELLVAYPGYTDFINGNGVNTFRIWGKSIYTDDIHPPSIPTQVAPPNNYCTNDTTVSFIWQHSEDTGSGIQYYVLRYADNSIFYPADSVSLVDTFFIINLTDTTYYWQVKAVDNANNHSDWSAARSFIIDTHPPGIPVLIFPENGCWLHDTSIVFAWGSLTDREPEKNLFRGAPIMYILQIDTASSFVNPLIVDTTQEMRDTVYLPMDGYRYYWRVKAYDLAGNQSSFSSHWNFRVDFVPPTSFSLSAPIDSIALSLLRPTFIWRTASDSLSGLKNYEIYINDSLKHVGVDTAWTADHDLLEGYSDWWVVAYDSAGNSRQSNEIWTVLIDTTSPSVVSLISPTNQSYANISTVNFVWHEANDNLSGVDHYLLQYALNSTFSLGLVETTLVDTTLTAYLSDTVYYWRVRSVDVANNEADFSPIWHFEIDTIIPITPTLLSPINGVILEDTLVVFEWTTVTDLAFSDARQPKRNVERSAPFSKVLLSPIHYVMELDTSLNFVSPMVSDTLDTTTATLPLCENYPFYWRVKAYDWAGNQGPYSNPDSFGIDVGPIVESTTVWIDTSFAGPFEVSTKVHDRFSGVDSVILYYKRDEDSVWVAKTMDSAGVPDWYADTIPEVMYLADTVKYYVEAIDNSGHIATDPSGAPEIHYSFRANYYPGVMEIEVMSKAFSISLKSNPAKDRVLFHLTLPEDVFISLTIYDVSGRLVGRPISAKKSAGHYEIPWYAKTEAGVYFYTLESPWQREAGKFVIID